MKKILPVILIIFLLLTYCSPLHAQEPTLQWEQTYGGTGDEFANAMAKTSDGGYVMAGRTESSNDGYMGYNHGHKDFWVCKVSSTGVIEWQGSFGGSYDDEATSVKQTSDGGYIVAGTTVSNDGDVTYNHGGVGSKDCWVIKLYPTGFLQWQKSFGGSSLDADPVIIQSSWGDFVMVANTYSNDGDVSGMHNPSGNNGDVWLAQIDTAGSLLYQACFGGSEADVPNDIQETTAGVVICGYSRSTDGDVSGNHGNNDYWAFEVGDNGIIWSKNYGGTNSDKANSIKQTADGGFIIAGTTESYTDDVTGFHIDGVTLTSDYWVVKTSSDGTIIWAKTYGGTDYDKAYSVIQTNDGNFAVMGESASMDYDLDHEGWHGFVDYWLVKMAAGDGSILWDKPLGGGLNDYGKTVVQNSDNTYAVCGSANSHDDDVTGLHVSGGSYPWDFWLAKLGPDNGTSGIADNTAQNISVSVLPNPANTYIRINSTDFENGFDVSITDVTGKQVMQVNAQTNREPVNIESLSKGFYLLQITDGKQNSTTKFIKQ